MRAILIVLTMAFISFIPWEGVIQYPLLGGAVKLVGIVMAAFWLLKVVIIKSLRKPVIFHLLVCCFVVWNAFSIYWSGNIDSTLGHFITWLQILILTIIFWDLFDTRNKVLLGLQSYILGCYIALGNTINNYFSGDTFYYGRFSAEGTNPDDLGAVLALGIPIAWYLASTFQPGKMSNIFRIINYIFIPASLLGMALSGTRTAIIASIPGMAYGFLSLMQFKLWTRVMILTLLLITIFTALPFVQTLPSYKRLGTTASELKSGSLSGRTQLWREGLNAFAERPLIGVGSNMYRSVTGVGKVAHNSFISVLVELGLIGFILFGSIVLTVFFHVLKHAKPHSVFWFVQFVTWGICASTLTMEHRKPTWLFFSLIIVSSTVFGKEDNKKNEISNAKV